MENSETKNFVDTNSQNIVLILNTHIPYVLEEGRIFQEQENWIFESITETYIPLFEVLTDVSLFHTNGNQIILSFTPCTIEQMTKGKDRYLEYLNLIKKVALAEIERTSSLESYNKQQKNKENLSEEQLSNINKTAKFYYERAEKSIKFYEENDVIDFIKSLKNVQLWTSSTNHSFLPLYNSNTAEYFVKRGIEEFENNFERSPEGIWLPECAFYPGMEKILVENGIKSTALNINSISFFTGKEKSGLYKYKDLNLYVHDFRICKYLWKAPKKTIPSHPSYREFYRDLGFDVLPEYLTSLGIPLSDNRKEKGAWTGFKYYAVSDPETSLGDKLIYNIDEAREQAKKDAARFFNILDENKEYVHDYQTFVLAFDTEFYGHWWLEGPWWLKEVFNYAD